VKVSPPKMTNLAKYVLYALPLVSRRFSGLERIGRIGRTDVQEKTMLSFLKEIKIVRNYMKN